MSPVRPPPKRELTLCFAGALEDEGSEFENLCTAAGQGVLKNGDSSVHQSFLRSASLQLYPRLFDALDTNGDAQVNDDDAPTNVNLVGYSWGGVAANDVAKELRNDSRVAPSRKDVAKLVTIDAFQPFADLRVPDNVKTFRSYRETNSADQTRDMFLGPYNGIRPVCTRATDCRDYDLSLRPRAADGSYPGTKVEHATMPREVFLQVYSLLKQGFDMNMKELAATVPILRDDTDE